MAKCEGKTLYQMKWSISDIERLQASGKILAYTTTGKQTEVPKTGKYRSRKTIVDGITFDSKKEACRYSELKFLQRIGEISDLRRQVVYQLSVCKYIADAVYVDKSGNTIVEDTKSKHTRKLPVYRLKKRMMKAELGIEIKEF